MSAEQASVLAVMRAAVPQPNEYTTPDFPAARKLAEAGDSKWDSQIARAKQQDRDFTNTLARIGKSNPDRDAGLCAVQREQRSKGVEDVLVHSTIRGWSVRTDWADGVRLFSCEDPGEAIAFAMRWQAGAPERRGVRMYGRDYFTALARMGNGAL